MDLARNLIGRINVGDSLTRTAASRPDQLAVVDGDRRFTYAEFNGYVNRLAHGLAGLGYERGCPRPPPARSRRTSCAPTTPGIIKHSTTRRADPACQCSRHMLI